MNSFTEGILWGLYWITCVAFGGCIGWRLADILNKRRKAKRTNRNVT